MKTQFRFKSLLFGSIILGLVSLHAVAQDGNLNEDVQKFRKDCMESLGNEPFCACMANVLNIHVPKEHLSHDGEGNIQFHEDMTQEAHNNATNGAKECQEKFRPEAEESND